MKSKQTALQQAVQLHQSGSFGLAKSQYLAILETFPDNSELLYLLGSVCYQMGELDHGKSYLEKSLAITPENPFALNNLGLVLAGFGLFSDAVLKYQQALAIKPDYLEAFNNLGNCYQSLHEYQKALDFYQRAIVLKPDYQKALRNQALAYHKLGEFDLAIKEFKKILEIFGDNHEDFYNLANIYSSINDSQQALAYFDRAIDSRPDYAHAHYNRGIVLQKLKQYEAALASFETALALAPSLNACLGSIRHLKNMLCDWAEFSSDLAKIVQSIATGDAVVSPFALLMLTDYAELQLSAARRFAQNLNTPLNDNTLRINPDCSRICIGLYSADFYDHATLHLLLDTLENLPKSKFKLVAFNFGPETGDAWQHRAKNCVDQFINCSLLSDDAIVELSRALAIDIAIDLKGYTQDARPGIFHRRPASVVINYLGYPGTMGSLAYDYLIADKLIIPEHYRQFYSEKIIYLPDCYQPNGQLQENISPIVCRRDVGLPEKGFVFCSFNQLCKLTPSVFADWMKILLATENSLLWILVSSQTAQDNLFRQAACYGVSPARLVFAEPLPIQEHLQRLVLADLMLDSYPCGAHTTGSDALRMGVPLITRIGDSFASRVASSLLKALKLEVLITETEAEYRKLAIEMVVNPDKFAHIKNRLQENLQSSSLFSPKLYADNLAQALSYVYQRSVSGLGPEDFEV